MIIDKSKKGYIICFTKYDPKICRDLIARVIIMHDLPFRFVKYKCIRAYFEYLHPNARVVSRNSYKVDVLKMYLSEIYD